MTKPVTRKLAVQCLLSRAFVFCAICKVELTPEDSVEFDHVHADIHGGPHEYQNLRPVHKECHKGKTKKDVQAKAKGDRILGLTKTGPKRPIKSGKKIPSRPFQKRVKPHGK